MFFRLCDDVALRGWNDVKCAYYKKGISTAQPLTQKQAEALKLCDGMHDIPMDESVMQLVIKKVVEVCNEGEHCSDYSLYKKYDNLYFPMMNLMVTGKCNYNCLHCFNAADNAPLMSEWEFENLLHILDQAKDIGVHTFTITGGEPMLHKNFMNILEEIYRRDMEVVELNTNGFYITQDILDRMKEIGCNPIFKISFDGIGYHDWMRQHEGAEKKTLDAMRLCIENGFETDSQTQVNRKNIKSIMPTARLLADMGINKMRIIRTTDVPRWAKNAPNATLSFEEYYNEMLSFASEYIRSGLDMAVIIWQYLILYPKIKCFKVEPVSCCEGQYRDSIPGCRGVRGMIAITSSGEVVPCMQESGLLKELGYSFGNLNEMSLKEVISHGKYLENICMTVGDIANQNPKCGNCKYFKYCTGGCRAIGLLTSGDRMDFTGADPTKCYFFENNWYEKVTEALSDWDNMSPMSL